MSTSSTPQKRGAGTADDPQELSDEDEALDDIVIIDRKPVKADIVAKETSAPTSVSKRKKHRPSYTYRQPVCELVPVIRQHAVWQKGHADLVKKIASTPRTDQNLTSYLSKLSDEQAKWGCILTEQPTGQAGPCVRCIGLGVDCLVQVEATAAVGGLRVVSRCITCLSSSRPCDVPNGRSKSSSVDVAAAQIRKTSRRKPVPDPTLARLAAMPAEGDLEALHSDSSAAPLPTAGPSKPRRKSGRQASEPAEEAPAPWVPRKQIDFPSDSDEKPSVNLGLLPSLKEIEVFMERMRVILSTGGELEFETFLMFQKVEEDVGVLKQHATDGAHIASALTSLKRVERFTNELRKMSTKDGELSFRMEIMFDTMDEHVKVFREVLGASK